MSQLRVAIVGGSLAGLTAGVLLRDAGYEVDIYERSQQPLSGFGAGIVMQPDLSRYFLERSPITLEQISVPSRAMRYFKAGTGSLIGETEASWRYTSYNALYRGLLAGYGQDRYHLSQALVGIEQDGDEVELRFASGRLERCDLAICADGGFSIGRQRLLGVLPRYAGYISWRGTAARASLTAKTWEFFAERFTYGLLDDGHVIAYPIPEVSDALELVGEQINFQWYWNVQEGASLDEMLTDRSGIRRPVSVHADAVQPRYLDEFARRARARLALEPMIELLAAVHAPFITAIVDTETPRMRIGRICLIGDAAITCGPHAAAGAAKAAADAWTLCEALVAADQNVEQALREWEPARLQVGYALLAKVRYMARLLQGGGPYLPGDPRCRFGLPVLA